MLIAIRDYHYVLAKAVNNSSDLAVFKPQFNWHLLTMVHAKNLLDKLDERYTRLLHVPVDSYMIEAVDMAVGGGWRKGKPWSGWDDPSYYARFQDAARKAAGDQAPIVWEGSVWVGIAKKRN